jgi:hypothetical protein
VGAELEYVVYTVPRYRVGSKFERLSDNQHRSESATSVRSRPVTSCCEPATLDVDVLVCEVKHASALRLLDDMLGPEAVRASSEDGLGWEQ